MSKSTILKFFLAIIVIIVIFFGYRFFFASSPDTPEGLMSLAPAGVSEGGAEVVSDEFVILLTSLREINLSDLPRVLALLSGLEDFSTDLEPQTPGRANPFSPIGVGGGVMVEPRGTTTATTTPSTGSGQAASSTSS